MIISTVERNGNLEEKHDAHILPSDIQWGMLQYKAQYRSSLGNILLTADAIGLTGLAFEGQRYSILDSDDTYEEKETEIISDAARWLDVYFSGREPDFTPPLHITGSQFQKEVCAIMRSIPYGMTMSYREIAKTIATRQGSGRMSARAVGGAVGHNRISIIIPCHRVIGADGNLTGYGGGIHRKIRLLELEGVDMSRLHIPRKGTAL